MDYLKSIPTHMDFDGQARAEKLFRIVIVLFGAVGLAAGYITQQFSHSVISLGAGCLLSGLLTIPPWPMYRRKPLNWQKAKDEAGSTPQVKKGKKK